MTRIGIAHDRVQQASELAAVLDAAYEAFEAMLPVIHPLQDPASGLFVAFVMAAASAADGRDALAFAPSLPRHPLLAAPAGEDAHCPDSPDSTAAAIAGLSQLVARRLTQATASAPDTGDRVAGQQAARCARDICGLLGGTGW